MATPHPNHQRLLDLLKSLDLNWPEQAKFVICFNNDPNVGEDSDKIKTATLNIFEKVVSQDNDSAEWVPTGLHLTNLPVGHA